VFVFCGCGPGRLVIGLETPTRDDLNPLKDLRLSKFGLRVSEGGHATYQDAVRGAGPELAVGDVPPGTSFDLRLAGKSAADDMLGLGLVSDLRVSAGDETVVSVKFRKPIGYAGPEASP
jgi:hypothetical protein